MTLRWKLIALLVVPLAALGGLTSVGVQQRLADTAEAGRAGTLVEVSAQVARVGNRLAAEEALSAWILASEGQGTETLMAARTATDAAIADLRAGLASFARTADGTSMRTTVVGLERTLAQIPVTRQAVDARPADPSGPLTLYAQAGTRVGDAAQQLASAATGTSVAPRLAGIAALQRSVVARATELAVLGGIVAADRVDPAAWASLRAAATATDVQRSVFLALATPELKAAERNTLAGPEMDAVGDLRDRALRLAPTESVGVNGSVWPMTVTGLLGRHDRLADTALAEAAVITDTAEREARADVLAYGALGLATAVFAVLTMVMAGRAITAPLERLTRAARRLADEDLPGLVAALRDPDAGEEDRRELDPVLPGRRRDEIGELARSFDAVQRTAVEVAREQAQIVDEGVSELFVNLARRNQSLLDRQITFLDALERDETDPDALAQLFTLDHLATRMRRNAESLLVLAGVEPGRRWANPLPLVDVVRAAIGEVEDYGRIDLTSLDPAGLAGPAVADVAHLLAEVLDNATQFSPPGTTVYVQGRRSSDGYLVVVSDHGIGMSAAQVAAANEELSRPAAKSLHLGRTLGFTVVGRLAARHGIGVQVASMALGGVTVTVSLPTSLVTDAPGDGATAGPALRRRADVPAAVWERLRQSAPAWPEDPPAVVVPPATLAAAPNAARAQPARPAAPSPAPSPVPASVPAPAPAPVPAPVPVPVAAVAGAQRPGLPEPRPYVAGVHQPVVPTPSPAITGRNRLAAATLAAALPSPATVSAALETITAGQPAPGERTASGLPRRRAGAALAETAAATALVAAGARPAGGTPERVAGADLHPRAPVAPGDGTSVTALPRRPRADVQPADGRSVTTHPGTGASGPAGAEAPVRRPEEIRALLSSYRSGLHRGRSLPKEDA